MVSSPEDALAQEIIHLHATICQALSDPSRICLLYALKDTPINVGDLADMLHISQPSVSRHLKILRERNLVIANRNGNSVYYQLADQRVISALDILREVLADALDKQAALAQAV